VLSYFTILCNTSEYKKMGEGTSPGQLYDVQNEVKVSKKVLVGPM
jgi:hypothetical protein